ARADFAALVSEARAAAQCAFAVVELLGQADKVLTIAHPAGQHFREAPRRLARRVPQGVVDEDFLPLDRVVYLELLGVLLVILDHLAVTNAIDATQNAVAQILGGHEIALPLALDHRQLQPLRFQERLEFLVTLNAVALFHGPHPALVELPAGDVFELLQHLLAARSLGQARDGVLEDHLTLDELVESSLVNLDFAAAALLGRKIHGTGGQQGLITGGLDLGIEDSLVVDRGANEVDRTALGRLGGPLRHHVEGRERSLFHVGLLRPSHGRVVAAAGRGDALQQFRLGRQGERAIGAAGGRQTENNNSCFEQRVPPHTASPSPAWGARRTAAPGAGARIGNRQRTIAAAKPDARGLYR